jgi:DNA-binding MarR family transcriptional regulator
MEQKANLSLIKTLNEIRILNLIREFGPISRSELAKRTHISKVAINDIRYRHFGNMSTFPHQPE